MYETLPFFFINSYHTVHGLSDLCLDKIDMGQDIWGITFLLIASTRLTV